MRNKEIAHILYEIADMLELQEVAFKPRAYRMAARSIENLTEPIENIAERGELEKIPSVGRNIATKIDEIVETGRLKYFEELKASFPFDIEALSAVEGVGPKKAKKLYDALGIKNLDELEQAAKAGRIRDVPDFGEKSERNILAGIDLAKAGAKRMLLGHAIPIANEIAAKLGQVEGVGEVEAVGSLRRAKETIGDLDFLVVSKKPSLIMEFFCKMPDVSRVLAKGKAKSAVEIDGLHVDLRVFERKSFGAAMQYFTGSKEHNVATRRIAIKKGLKLNEYGLFKGKKRIAGESEKGVYAALGLQWIPPELRENKGEVEAAGNRALPKLITHSCIHGDLHVHTNWSEGANSIEEMAMKGAELGYDYIAICDHAGNLPIANAMNEKKIQKQGKEIDKLNQKLDTGNRDGPYLLKGAEVNILPKGGVDVPNSILRELDIVVAGIHRRMHDPLEKNMQRLFSAMDNEYVDIIAHPSGRLINKREPYLIDIDELVHKAKETGTILEINCQPDRLDLKDEHVRSAVEAGAMLSIDTDAHATAQLDYMDFGIMSARRGWCERKNVLNCLRLKELRKRIGF
jgi:DNA polymerase (family 10)